MGKGFKKKFRSDKRLETAADLAGFSHAALGVYWRSNTMAVLSQLARGEFEEAMETFNVAAATLGTFDLGQGIFILFYLPGVPEKVYIFG